MLNIAVCDDPVFLAQIRELLDRDERVGMVSLYRSRRTFWAPWTPGPETSWTRC